MRRFIVGFFAVIGFFAFAAVLVSVGVLLFLGGREKPLADADILLLDLSKPLAAGAPDDGFGRLLIGEEVTLRDVLDGIERAGDDRRIKGIVARLGGGELASAKVQELRDAVGRFRAKGKFAFAYAESLGELGNGMRGYYLATAFDEVWLQPMGEVGLAGLRAEMPFFKGLLEKLGIEPRFDHRSEYKTAMNVLTESAMTGPHREETEALLHSVFDQMVEGIAQGRRLDPAHVRALIDAGPFDTQQALEAHLIDHLGYRDDAVAAARTRAGENAQVVALMRYIDAAGRPHDSGPTIAVIYGTGLITSGSSSSNPLSGSGILGADSLAKAFRQASEDASVRAILFRVDSPGGSAAASETIWREVARAREAGKPVIVSMGDVAGSGGYYIAAPADKIVAEPATLTGSIGVVGGKILIRGLSEKLGVTWDGVQIGRNAGISSTVDDFTPAERERFEHSLDYVYAGFKDRVAQGRKLSADAVEAVAKGRVWTGAEAKERGLVDALGGFDTALALAKAAAGIAAEREVTLKTFPPPANTPGALIAKLLGRENPDESERAAFVALRPLLHAFDFTRAPGALVMPPIDIK